LLTKSFCGALQFFFPLRAFPRLVVVSTWKGDHVFSFSGPPRWRKTRFLHFAFFPLPRRTRPRGARVFGQWIGLPSPGRKLGEVPQTRAEDLFPSIICPRFFFPSLSVDGFPLRFVFPLDSGRSPFFFRPSPFRLVLFCSNISHFLFLEDRAFRSLPLLNSGRPPPSIFFRRLPSFPPNSALSSSWPSGKESF